MTDINLNTESILIYNDIKNYIEKFKHPKPHSYHELFRLISLEMHNLLLNKHVPNVIKHINKDSKSFTETDHCKNYDEFYKELIYEIVRTEYVKLLKNSIYTIDDIFIYRAIKELEKSKRYESALLCSKSKIDFSIFSNALLALSNLFIFNKKNNTMCMKIHFCIGWYKSDNEFSEEKVLKFLLDIENKDIKK